MFIRKLSLLDFKSIYDKTNLTNFYSFSFAIFSLYQCLWRCWTRTLYLGKRSRVLYHFAIAASPKPWHLWRPIFQGMTDRMKQYPSSKGATTLSIMPISIMAFRITINKSWNSAYWRWASLREIAMREQRVDTGKMINNINENEIGQKILLNTVHER